MSRSSEVKTDPPYLFRNPRGPSPRHPGGLKCQPQPAPTPKHRGPCLGDPGAGPRPGHTSIVYPLLQTNKQINENWIIWIIQMKLSG